MYQLMNLSIPGGQETVRRMADDAIIPFDPANTDYQAYLVWLAEGNTPEPAEAT